MKAVLLEHAYRTLDYIEAGGIVIVPLIAISVILWSLIINRTLFFRRLYRKNMPRHQAAECITTHRMPDTIRYRGAITLLVTEFLSRRSGDPALDRYILDEAVVHIIASLDKYLSSIQILARMAPLLGLLGTVTGMIAAFSTISVFGTGNARALTSGISEALITTQTGLMVAIPGLYMSHFLARRAENLKQHIASTGMYLQRFL